MQYWPVQPKAHLAQTIDFTWFQVANVQVESITHLPPIWFWGTDKFVNPSVNLWWILVLLSCCFPSAYKTCCGAALVCSDFCCPFWCQEHQRPAGSQAQFWENRVPASRLPGCSVLACLVHTSLEDANLFSIPWPCYISSACCWHNPSRLCLRAWSFCLVNTTLGSYLAYCSFPAICSP